MLHYRFCSAKCGRRLAIDIGNKGDQAFPEFVFGADADVAQHRTRQLGEEALNEIEP